VSASELVGSALAAIATTVRTHQCIWKSDKRPSPKFFSVTLKRLRRKKPPLTRLRRVKEGVTAREAVARRNIASVSRQGFLVPSYVNAAIARTHHKTHLQISYSNVSHLQRLQCFLRS